MRWEMFIYLQTVCIKSYNKFGSPLGLPQASACKCRACARAWPNFAAAYTPMACMPLSMKLSVTQALRLLSPAHPLAAASAAAFSSAFFFLRTIFM